jgi:hypothetical protein
MKTNLIFKKSKFVITAILAITSLVLIAASPASVYAKQIGTNNTDKTKSKDTQLSDTFHRAKDGLTTLTGDIKQVQDLRSSFQHLVSASGKNMQTTEKDMSLFTSDLSHAEQLQKVLAALLNTHPGFAANGDVLNITVASMTSRTLNSYATTGLFWVREANSAYNRAQSARQK